MPPKLVLLACLACAPLLQAASAQSEYLIDFGDDELQTGTQGQVWNDVHKANVTQVVPLVDSAGNATSVSLFFASPLARSEFDGVELPTPGSALEQLAWPVSAISDSLYSDSLSGVPEAELELSGLDPTGTCDLTILGSLLESGVSLTAEYTAFGAAAVAVIGEAAENTSEVFYLRGIRPAGDGTLGLRIRHATTNTSSERRFYLNALSLVEHPAATQPALLSFDTNRLDAARVSGKGPVTGTLGLYTSSGASPHCELTAVDEATGAFPVWLSMPATAKVGTAFDVTLDPGPLVPGTYAAELQALSGGLVPYGLRIEFTVRAPGRLNLLYYGNSYSAANGSVTILVDRLAEEAGLDVPHGVARFFAGTNLVFHLGAAQVEAISRSMPLGEEWDHVVMQGGTLEAAASVGNPTLFVTHGLEILANVRAHSPQARALVLQTWARGAGHPFYQGPTPTYPDPLAMHLELEDGNRQLAQALDAAYGVGTAAIAAAGETSALRGFDPAIYKPDLGHPQPELTAQAALTVFSSLYGLAACGLEVDFDTPGPLASHLFSIGLDPDAWHRAAGVGDLAGAPELRKYPGSSEDLLLWSGVPGNLTACGLKSHAAGTLLRFELRSPGGSLGQLPAWIYFDRLGLSGGTTVVPPWPEAHYTPSAWIQAASSLLGSGGLAVEFTLPVGLVGQTLLVQGVSEGASGNTGNWLTFSDAQAVLVLPPGALVPAAKNP